jgi:hypothetical protein
MVAAFVVMITDGQDTQNAHYAGLECARENQLAERPVPGEANADFHAGGSGQLQANS